MSRTLRIDASRRPPLRPRRTACGSFALLASAGAWALPDEAATEQVRARLVSSVHAVVPGAEILLGVNQRIIPHWHTYWKNPGDSGLPTTIDWHLPQGASAGEILWPVPGRITVGSVTNYAYSDEVTLLSQVRVPADAMPGQLFTIAATVKWLVCEEICIPQQVELGLTLPVVADKATVGAGSPLIANARAALPVESTWPAHAEYAPGEITLHLGAEALRSPGVVEIAFFPDRWGMLVHGAAQTPIKEYGGVSLKLQPGEEPPNGSEPLTGVLAVTQKTPEGVIRRGFSLSAVPGNAGAPGDGGLTVAGALGLALLGGVVLNLMPCVFPILSLKALHLLKQGHEPARTARLQGLAYTLGVLLSFALLGLLIVVLKWYGTTLGWGFQFQSPLFVLLIAYLMFSVGLSLSGVITIGGNFTGLGSRQAEQPGYAGSFFTGVLATLVAAPCTAPFMGAAVGFALTQPPLALIAVLLALGLGLALPFLLLSFWPALRSALPKPGPWMETLKQALAFPMYATAGWLVWVLAKQTGHASLPAALGGMLAIGFAAWIFERTRPLGTGARRLGAGLALLALLAPVAGAYVTHISGPSESEAASAITEAYWEPYAADRLQALRAQGAPVFLNLTADWCISCLINERVALNVDAVKHAFRKAGLTYLKGDWTSRDPAITEKLAEFGRSGVPLYVHYPAGADSEPVVLPQILTPEIVLSAIKAGSDAVVRHSP